MKRLRVVSAKWGTLFYVWLLLVFVLSGVCTLFAGGTTRVEAQGVLVHTFARAAHDYQVPEPLLKGLCYMEGRLSNHGGTASMDHGYGCMHLLMNDHAATLEQAAHDLGVTPTLLRSSMVWNIRGGAAILRDAARRIVRRPAAVLTLGDWYPVVAAYSAASRPAVEHMYADSLFALLRTGFRASAEDGEVISLAPQVIHVASTALPARGTVITTATPQVARPRHIGASAKTTMRAAWQVHTVQTTHREQRSALPAGCVDDHHTDYPLAVDCILKPHLFDCNSVADAIPCTYEDAKRPDGDLPIEFLVIHDIEGSAQAALAWFHNPSSAGSAHYVVDSDGTIYQVVHERDIAYHAGNYWYNQRSIGIEHAGYDATGYEWYNATLYLASASLSAYLLNKYHIPLDHDHILSHGTIPASSLATNPNHVDPGPYWLWDDYFSLIHHMGVPYSPVSANSTIIMLHPLTDLIPLRGGGRETAGNYNYFPLYNGPSTQSGLVPSADAGSGNPLDESGNIEPDVSYVATNAVLDPAGSGKMLYEIWYGIEDHLNASPPDKLANARQVWLAVDPNSVTRGHGIAIALQHPAHIYARPDMRALYVLGDAPVGAIFNAPFAISSNNSTWYLINYNHRQAWLPIDAIL